jgi:hypothetical protein
MKKGEATHLESLLVRNLSLFSQSAQNVQVIQEVVKGGADKRRRKQEEEEMSNGEVSDEDARRGRGRG